MSDNQHQKIKGYRDLSEEEIALTNYAKDIADWLVEALGRNESVDRRWLTIAKTDLQKSFIALIRSIARPTTF